MVSALLESILRRWELYLRDYQCGSDFDKMSLTDTINLQDAFHRCAVTPGNFNYCLAALDPMVHNLGLGLWLARSLLDLRNSDERRHGSVHRQLYAIAGGYYTGCGTKRRIPTQEFIAAKSRRGDH